MNIFSKLPFLSQSNDEEETLSPEQIAAEEKRERKEFHRLKVRNGPTLWKTQTNGQVKRARLRSIARDAKKAYRAEVRNYLELRRLAAVVRGHLQIVGIIPFIDGHEEPLERQVASTRWLMQRFGSEVVVEGRRAPVISFREGDVLDGLRVATEFYSKVTGAVVRVPAGYTPALVWDEAAA